MTRAQLFVVCNHVVKRLPTSAYLGKSLHEYSCLCAIPTPGTQKVKRETARGNRKCNVEARALLPCFQSVQRKAEEKNAWNVGFSPQQKNLGLVLPLMVGKPRTTRTAPVADHRKRGLRRRSTSTRVVCGDSSRKKQHGRQRQHASIGVQRGRLKSFSALATAESSSALGSPSVLSLSSGVGRSTSKQVMRGPSPWLRPPEDTYTNAFRHLLKE